HDLSGVIHLALAHPREDYASRFFLPSFPPAAASLHSSLRFRQRGLGVPLESRAPGLLALVVGGQLCHALDLHWDSGDSRLIGFKVSGIAGEDVAALPGLR